MAESRFLAFDLGASNGRAVVGTLADGRLSLEVIHRFDNEPVEVCGTVYWNILGLYQNVLTGMRTYVDTFGDTVDGIGIDTWGVDFGLLGRDGALLANPVHYRDRRTEGTVERVCSQMPAEEVFQHTGMSLWPIQTLFQLLAMRLGNSPVLGAATRFLMMPDLLAYYLTGRQCVERTNAIATQLYDTCAAQWWDGAFDLFGLPRSIMPELVDPGTVLGEVSDAVKRETGLKRGVVIAPCTHDTGSAVAAVPGQGADWAFLSSGTWSVVGALVDEPVTTHEAFAAGLCNELTVDGLFLCRNIMGLWLLQQARAVWQRQGQTYSYDDLAAMASDAPADGPVVDPDDPAFLAPDDMCQTIRDYCTRTSQSPPATPGEVARCVLDSLALTYRYRLDQLADMLERSFRVLHVVGGGCHNRLLCQFTADATGLPVLAGPAEATVVGNLLVQAMAVGRLASPTEVRDTARRSAHPVTYEPRDTPAWEARYERFRRLVG